jgi:HTH-type transcriptional regulator / antitoxin HigA
MQWRKDMVKNKKIKPSVIIGPGYTIKKYIEARGWTQDDLAQLTDISSKQLSQIINDKVRITINTAKLLGKSFGTSPEFWINLDTNYRLNIESDEKKENSTQRKATIRKFMPVSEILRKKWFSFENTADGYESLFEYIWEAESVDTKVYEENENKFCARQKNENEEYTKLYTMTWHQIAKLKSKKISVAKYDKRKLKKIVEKYTEYTFKENGIPEIINDLNNAGVKFFVLSHLTKTYLDGACFMDGKNPVIVYTGRYDRIDNFWFTLAHELAHVLLHLNSNNDKYFIDDLSVREEVVEEEVQADEKAEDILKIKEILAETKPVTKYYSEVKIRAISEKLKIEKSVIVGVLQYYNHIDYRSKLNSLKKKVVELIPEKIVLG